jgi:steroid 5-alpha reductase family enzyme
MTMWWGIWLMSVNFFTPLESLLGIISPLTITWLLTRVSGVPMLESKYKKDPDYQEYIKQTPSFFPRFFR